MSANALPNDYLLLMTACIAPPPGRVVRDDVQTRLTDYQTALAFWLENQDARLKRILFVDNSGYPLEGLRAFCQKRNIFGKQIEMISVPESNVVPAGFNYGFAELAMVDAALPVSTLAASAKYVLKVTGRLRFAGISRLLDRLPREFLFAVDARPDYPVFAPTQKWMHTRVWISSIAFYLHHLRNLRFDMRSGEHLENVMYRNLMRYKDLQGAFVRFPVHVSPRGVGGFLGSSYDTPPRRIIEAGLSISRIFFPGLWV